MNKSLRCSMGRHKLWAFIETPKEGTSRAEMLEMMPYCSIYVHSKKLVCAQ